MLCQNHFNIVGRCYGNAIKKGKYTSLFISIKEKKVLTLLKVVAFGQIGEDLLLMGRDKNTLAIQGHMRTITHRDRFNNQTTQVYFMVDDAIILTKFKPLDIKNLPKRAIKKVIEEPLPERKGKK
jgi:ATP-dependent phosphoenolpyruvate carboxykinase